FFRGHSAMTHRTRISLAVVGSLLLFAFGPSRAEEPKGGAKPQLTKADIEEMMHKSLSNWGRWGDKDELGTLNLITPEKRKQAAQLVKEGVTVSMAHDVIKTESASSPGFGHKMTGLPKDTEVSSSADEYRVSYHGFTQTHVDALCHLFYQGKMYNGYSQSEVTAKGAGKLGVQNAKNGIFTRGVLMDMPRLFDVRFLKGAQAIYPKDLY